MGLEGRIGLPSTRTRLPPTHTCTIYDLLASLAGVFRASSPETVPRSLYSVTADPAKSPFSSSHPTLPISSAADGIVLRQVFKSEHAEPNRAKGRTKRCPRLIKCGMICASSCSLLRCACPTKLPAVPQAHVSGHNVSGEKDVHCNLSTHCERGHRYG